MTGRYTFTADAPGSRLDRFVADNLPELSRTRARELIDAGLVTVNAHVGKASLKLEAGDAVTVEVPPEKPVTLAPEAIPLAVLYEDDDLLVIDKPAGLPVHPAPGHPGHTLVNAVLNYLPQTLREAGDLRPGIVHRLDKDTSGLILVAKHRAAQAALAAQFAARTVAKTYLVLVRGTLEPDRGVIEASIGRDTRNRQRMAVVEKGRAARTAYRVLRVFSGYTLAEIHPETGRTHQIRVHLKAIGYPVVGDATYGVAVPFLGRQFLHAHRLTFRLPSTGEEVTFTSPLPPDLERALAAVK